MGNDIAVIMVVCDMSTSHRAQSFYEWSSLVMFFWKMKTREILGGIEKLYNNNFKKALAWQGFEFLSHDQKEEHVYVPFRIAYP